MTTRSLLDRAGTLLGLFAVALLFGLLLGWQFFEPANLELMARQTAIVGMAAIGMTAVIVAGGIDLCGIGVARTGGRHGTGEIGARMGPVSGFVLRAPGEPALCVAGDTIWCEEVEDALAEHDPDVVVVNAGGARFLEGDPIIMDADGVIETARAAPRATIVAVHLEALNHCPLTRADLRAAVDEAGVGGRVLIPADGETVRF